LQFRMECVRMVGVCVNHKTPSVGELATGLGPACLLFSTLEVICTLGSLIHSFIKLKDLWF